MKKLQLLCKHEMLSFVTCIPEPEPPKVKGLSFSGTGVWDTSYVILCMTQVVLKRENYMKLSALGRILNSFHKHLCGIMEYEKAILFRF